MTAPPKTRRGVRRAPGQGEESRAAADHGVERNHERRGPRFPAPEPDGRLRSTRRSTTGSTRRGGDHRHAGKPPGSPESRSMGQDGVLPEGRECDRVHRRQCRRFGKGEGVFMFNGDWQNGGYNKDLPGKCRFFVFPAAEAGGSVAAMPAPVTYVIANTAKNNDCAALFFNWVGRMRTPARSTWPSAARTPAAPPTSPFPPAQPAPSPRNAGRRRRRQRRTVGRWTSSPTRRARSSPRAGHPSSRSSSAAR